MAVVAPEGQFAIVYRAEGKLDNVSYAIKKLKKKCETEEEKCKIIEEVSNIINLISSTLLESDLICVVLFCFVLQVRALAVLSDQTDAMKYIVRYYNSWFEDDHLLIQMELCETSAADIHDSLEPQLYYDLLRDILHALDILHSNSFFHLNIKPGNILRKRDHFKLADFGLAAHFTRNRFQNRSEGRDSHYTAKELLANDSSIEDLSKCDIFSLGATGITLSLLTSPLIG